MSRGRGARNAAIEVFGDRWSLLVLRDIVFADRRYFRELQAGSQEGIASNILADRAITERSRAPERGLPRCYQLLVAARQSTMSRAPTDAARAFSHVMCRRTPVIQRPTHQRNNPPAWRRSADRRSGTARAHMIRRHLGSR
jgi:hypothetical protein